MTLDAEYGRQQDELRWRSVRSFWAGQQSFPDCGDGVIVFDSQQDSCNGTLSADAIHSV